MFSEEYIKNVELKIGSFPRNRYILSDGSERELSPLHKREIIQAIREWRLSEAEKISLPAYCIFSDKVLSEIVEIMPTRKNMLWLVSGLAQI